jgi:beta-glucosidase
LTVNHFGESFIWGASISAAQTESATDSGGKGPSIWDEFCNRPSRFFKKHPIKNREHLKNSADFYTHYKTDIDHLKSIGFKHFRFSIAWARVMPDGENINIEGFEFYQSIVAYCLENGITPWITLYHWDLPQALEKKGGWTNPEIVQWFEQYATACIEYLPNVKHWILLNEPSVFVGAGYFFGIHAPGRKGVTPFIKALHHANLCINKTYFALKKINPELQIGSSFSFTHIESSDSKPHNKKAAKLADILINRLFFEPIIGKGYPIESIKLFTKSQKNYLKKDEHLLKTPLDFIGVQNYTRELFKYNYLNPLLPIKHIPAVKRTKELTMMNWEIHPPSIYHTLIKLNQYQLNTPLYITENGIALNDVLENNGIQDYQRIIFYQSHLQEVLNAKNEGVDIKGYFTWSLIDNFEWAEGYEPRFGLIHVDFVTKKRTLKESAQWFNQFLGRKLGSTLK